MADITQIADQIHDRFSEEGVDRDDVERRLHTLVDEYSVPVDEARRSVENHYSKQTGVPASGGGSAQPVTIDSIDRPEEWVTLRVKVVELWDSDSDAVAQTGLVADETGRTKFTAWAKSDLPELEEGASYELRNVVTDEFQGRSSVKLNSETEIEELEEAVEVGSADLGAPEVDVVDVDEPDEWVNLRVKVVELWDSDSDAVAQTGLVADETGQTKFTAWAKSDLPELEEGSSYLLENVVTDEFQERMSVKLNSTTTITEIDEDVEVGSGEISVEGALVDVQSGSGLIKRCPEEDCTRVLQNGRCSEHGEVEGEFDLRVKGVIDDGESVTDVLLDREMTEEVTGITMEEAKQESMDALDTSVVTDRIEGLLVGRYYRVTGPRYGRYLLVNEMEEAPEYEADLDDLLMEARSV